MKTITPEYRAWQEMKRRCTNPRREDYQRWYGALGVTVWSGWLNDYPAFLAHVGRRPTTRHSLDRIDACGNYEPGNVRWATAKEQRQNQRKHRTTP